MEPTPKWPSLQAILDELPKVTDEEMKQLLDDPDPLMRKAARTYFSTARATTSPPSTPDTPTEKT